MQNNPPPPVYPSQKNTLHFELAKPSGKASLSIDFPRKSEENRGMDLSLLQSSPVITSPKSQAQTITAKKVGRPLKYPSVKLMSTLVDQYFNRCDAKHRPYTITGLALALDMTREQLIQYQEREEFQDTIKKAKQRVAAYAEEQLFRHGGQVTGIIFSLKNNFGWKDAVEHVSKSVNISELLKEIEESARPIL